VFGVLISPTDPIAVIAMTRRSTLQPELQAQLEGEALFNDGVAVVAFKAVTAFAIGSGLDHGVSLALAEQAALAAVGGAGLGLVCGFAAVLLIRVVDDWISETLITVATATAVYALALHFDLSGPVGVVVSGLVVGSQWAERRMSKVTLRHIHPFWRVLDEGMNAVLFFLLGVEVWALGGTWSLVWLAVCGPVVVLLARWVAVSIPLSLLPLAKGERRVNLINVVTWAGVRGGLPVAMALALPDVPARQPILAATFAVVLFSILLQSMTTERLALRTGYGHPAAQA
jgi:CPA1 family monovalent cation:H+ antiporter